MYSDNPAYQLQLTTGNYRVYTPVNIMEGYSTQRYVEAINQQIYANSGTNKEVLEDVMNEIIKRCNDDRNKSIRTEIGALAQSILYRIEYPVDQHCAVRMGAILSFVEHDIEGKTIAEPADKIETVWLKKKEELAFSNDEAYTFFLTWGIVNTPTYKEVFDFTNALEYFRIRTEALRSLDIKLSSS